MRWIYSEIGAPLWAWEEGGDQAVLFYAPNGPFSTGFPPMTDEDERRWREAHEKRAR